MITCKEMSDRESMETKGFRGLGYSILSTRMLVKA